MVAIAIIGILATSLITVLNPLAQIQKARDAKRKGDISQIQKALETYYNDVGVYPPNPSLEDYRIKDLNGNPIPWGKSWMPYINTLPKDPSYPARNYVYYSPSGGQSYYLYASLERGVNDLQVCKSDGSACSSVPFGQSCGGIDEAVCNYGVSSPNVSP